jgi:hypothetical protein
VHLIVWVRHNQTAFNSSGVWGTGISGFTCQRALKCLIKKRTKMLFGIGRFIRMLPIAQIDHVKGNH